MKKRFLSILLVVLTLSGPLQAVGNKQIRRAVERQRMIHPELTLQDLYKSFSQDYFGPGHIIPDSEAARSALRQELLRCGDRSVITLYEPTGARGRYVRVDLSVVADGTIPEELFLQAFINSARPVSAKQKRRWVSRWERIERVISRTVPSLPDRQTDSERIDALLQQGEYALHHSARFAANYQPHYRIIRRSLFQSEMLPRIEATHTNK